MLLQVFWHPGHKQSGPRTADRCVMRSFVWLFCAARLNPGFTSYQLDGRVNWVNACRARWHHRLATMLPREEETVGSNHRRLRLCTRTRAETLSDTQINLYTVFHTKTRQVQHFIFHLLFSKIKWNMKPHQHKHNHRWCSLSINQLVDWQNYNCKLLIEQIH